VTRGERTRLVRLKAGQAELQADKGVAGTWLRVTATPYCQSEERSDEESASDVAV
jgi:hypothetical protein